MNTAAASKGVAAFFMRFGEAAVTLLLDFARRLLDVEIMTPARTFLLEALSRVAEGGDINEAELDAPVPSPLMLSRDEKIAWDELSHWIDDDDIRERDPRYAGQERTCETSSMLWFSLRH